MPDFIADGASALRPDWWLCFIVGRVSVFEDYGGYWILYCINLTDLFEPCESCTDGQNCRFSNGKAECVYECGADEVGGGKDPCKTCGDGEVANSKGTACEKCEHGESSTAGTCNPDPCEGVTCTKNAQCSGGKCECKPGYKGKPRTTGTDTEPETVLECVPDPCHGKVCGKNSACSDGKCQCKAGFEDPDDDGDCTKPCTEAAYDAKAKSSLLSIAKEPWERGEAYGCDDGQVTVSSPRNTASKYLYTDFPTNSVKNPKAGDVCTLRIRVDRGGGGHSHPHFVWPRDEDVQCGPNPKDKIRTRDALRMTNRNNANFQPVDKSAAKNAANGDGLPLYLVVPNRDCVKVYRKSESSGWLRSGWRQSGCL